MIYMLPIFCILNIIMLYFSKLTLLYYIGLIEGIITLVYMYKLSCNNIFYPLNKKININHKEILTMKVLLSLFASILIISGIICILKLMNNDTVIVLFESIPLFISSIVFIKLNKYK